MSDSSENTVTQFEAMIAGDFIKRMATIAQQTQEIPVEMFEIELAVLSKRERVTDDPKERDACELMRRLTVAFLAYRQQLETLAVDLNTIHGNIFGGKQ